MTTTVQTRSQKMNADITALLKAKNSLLWVTTREEYRVESAITEAAAAAQFVVRFWDCAQGITAVNDKGDVSVISPNGDPEVAIAWLRALRKERVVLVMRDLHKWFGPSTLRQLRNAARALESAERADARTIIILTPDSNVPPELTGHAVVLDYPLPDRSEIASMLDDVLSNLPQGLTPNDVAPNGTRDAAIDAAVGLSANEAMNCYTLSLVAHKRIDPVAVSNEKKRVISREKVLTWYDPDPRGLDAVGGLDVLKSWLMTRKRGFSAAARKYKLPTPKGVFLAGLPGVGKSLVAKCIASAFGMPLLRIDMGALKSKYVGDSEANLRKALALAETMAPCVLWADEIEKSLKGATGEQGDGGVSADALGAMLSWMQEQRGVFVVATANDVRALPPELLRKGRFDEVFWVDLPNENERAQILTAALKQYEQDPKGIDVALVAASCPDYTGSEIAAIVPDAMFVAFNDGERPITEMDLIAAAKCVTPMSTTQKEKIDELREWAKTRARAASTPVTEATARKGRKVEI